mmetsp:Transcript_12826/g.15925  ORF Transcript_12826/g.15925 Transcript_12826/m.15925 type:complete len:271 (-) Transcript_12826:540-1352(-)
MSRRVSRRSGSSLSEEPSYYEILKVGPNVDEEGIKKAYRKQAIKWHPDKNKDNQAKAEAMFKRVAEAYEVLSDPEKRRIYDHYGKEGLSNSNGGSSNFRNGFDFHQHFDMNRAQSLFEEFFGSDPFFSRGFGSGFGSQRGQGGSRDPFFDDPFDAFFDNRVGHGRQTQVQGRGRGNFMDMNDPFDSFFGGAHGGHIGMGGGFSSSSSFSSSSGGGMSKSTRTVTQIVNGQRVTKTETTTRYPDGRVETTTDESTGQIDDGDSRRERLQYW